MREYMSWVEATEPRLDVTARREKRRLWSRNERTNENTGRIDGVLDHGRGTRKRQSNGYADQSKSDHIKGRGIGRKETHRCAHGACDNTSETNIFVKRKSFQEVIRSESHNSEQNRCQRRHESVGRLGKHVFVKKSRSTRNEHPPTRIQKEIQCQ